MALLDRLMLLIDADGSRATSELNLVARTAKETLSVGQQFGRDFLKGLGVGAGALTGFAAADALKRLGQFSVEAARGAEQDIRSQAVLARALQSSTGATNEQVRAVEGYISVTSRSVGVVDDELRPALATLARSTGDVASAQKLLNLALDVSAGTGRDLGTVSLALAKGYEGQTTALGRLLPEVSGLVREGASGAQVFNRLQREFHGTAEAAAEQAGQFARLKVIVDNMSESYGHNLLPQIKLVADAGDKLSKVQERLGGLGGLGQVAGFLSGTKSISDIANARALQENLRGLEARLDNVADSGGIFSSKLRELGYGTLNWGNQLGITTSTVLGFEASLRASASAAADFLSSVFGVSSAEDKFNDALDGTTASTGRATAATRDLIAEEFNRVRSARSVHQAELDLLDAEKNLEVVRKGASDREKKRAGLDVREAQNRVAQAQRRIADATNDLNKATGRRGNTADAEQARQALADALLEQERANEDLIDVQERSNDTMKRGTAGSEDLADATKKVEDAQWGLREAIESQRQSAMQDETDGGPVGRSVRQQRDAFREAANAATDVITALVSAGAPTDVINGKIGEMVTKLTAAGIAAGVTQDEIKKTADLLIAFGALGQAEQQRNLAGIYGFGAFTLKEELDAMRRQGIYVPDIAYQLAGGRAGGGPTNAGMSYTVGENGKETLHMGNSPGWVTPNGGGGMTVNFNGTVVADKVTLERLVYEAWQSAQRRGWN